MKKPQWHPRNVISGFEDTVEDAQPRLTEEQFKKVVTANLNDHNFRDPLPPGLLTTLFRKTSDCLKRMEALSKMQPLVRGKDWKRAQKTLRRVIEKELPGVLFNLKQDQNPRFPMSNVVISRLTAQLEELREDLQLTVRFARNDEDLVSGYLRPTLASQFMLNLDLYLKRKLPSKVTVEQRRVLVAACSIAAEFFPAGAAADDLQERIGSRIYRALQSYKRVSQKWEWVEQEENRLITQAAKGSPKKAK